MRPGDRELAQRLEQDLLAFQQKQPLLGIDNPIAREIFIEQLLESIHRIKYVSILKQREPSQQCADPSSDLFDPLKASILFQRQGNVDEAFWMIFLFVHFGKHAKAGWRYAREIYGRLGDGGRWDWVNTSTDPYEFRVWLHNHQAELMRPGVSRGFGNHRKYESLNACSNTGTGTAVESYVMWVGPAKSHSDKFNYEYIQAGCEPRRAFARLYHSMNSVKRFGRTARFDYLATISKLGLADIVPDSAYLKGATGPLSGAKLLFTNSKRGSASPSVLENLIIELDEQLGVGMQVLEDALCNWQKSPNEFKKFRG